ncbi:hypothetical protein AKJ09_00517 [Labilithrix luteola]|uniref:Type IV fimbrial biogenesis protein PilY1 n=1 Tax=Labilithrix luteola TaxID=1391654 RepID=A0A0K1PJY5_9BACT|nr:hypothetical protein [Labilithrix luteola]AKU93853.1 hypothetical protein AKJ09_00517 [Labilithrix luteola]
MNRRVLFLSTLVMAASSAHLVSACAESNDVADSHDGASTALPSEATEAGGEAIGDGGLLPSDAATDAACSGDVTEPTCFVAKDCASATFCAENADLDSRYTLFAVRGSSKNDVWTVGAGGTILHYDGSTWSPVPIERRESLYSLWVTSPNDVWFIGSGTAIWHGTGPLGTDFTFAGAAIRPTPSYNAPFPAAWMSPDQTILMVGGGTFWQPGATVPGSIWALSGMSTKPTWTSAGNTVMMDAFWSNGTDLWRVGPKALAQRSLGFWSLAPTAMRNAAWQQLDPQTSVELTSIIGFSDGNVWTVGKQGTVRRYSGGPIPRFDIVPVPTDVDLSGIWGTSSNDLWVVGDRATILHWDGQRWTHAPTFVPGHSLPDLHGVWGSGGDVWAVGAGAILRLQHPTQSDAGGGVQ